MSKRARLIVLAVAAVVLLGAWVVNAEQAPNPPASSIATPTASPEGLVLARHDNCNYGSQLLHYLQTGDAGGDPWFDQHFSDDVGASTPQARAIADKAIETCDAADDQQDANAARDVSASAEATASATAQADLRQKEAIACQGINGQLQTGNLGDLCVSKTPEAVSGTPDHTRCSLGSLNFTAAGTLDPHDVAFARTNYPACYTLN